MMFREFTLASGLLMALAGSAHGQRTTDSVRVGDRVRIWVPESAPQKEHPFRLQQMIRGEVTRIAGDTVALRPAPELGELLIPVAQIRQVDRSRGVPNRFQSALTSGVGLAVLGAALWAVQYSVDGNDFGVTNRREAALLGAGAGFVSGVVIGALLPSERWRRIRQPTFR